MQCHFSIFLHSSQPSWPRPRSELQASRQADVSYNTVKPEVYQLRQNIRIDMNQSSYWSCNFFVSFVILFCICCETLKRKNTRTTHLMFFFFFMCIIHHRSKHKAICTNTKSHIWSGTGLYWCFLHDLQWLINEQARVFYIVSFLIFLCLFWSPMKHLNVQVTPQKCDVSPTVVHASLNGLSASAVQKAPDFLDPRCLRFDDSWVTL